MMNKKPMLSAVQKPKLYYTKPKMAGMKKPKMGGVKKPKLNEGFDSLPSKVQAKILKNKKPKMAAVKKPMDAERKAVRKLNAASRKSMKADSKDMKRDKLASELRKKLGAKKYEVLRTKNLKGLSVSDRNKVSEINRLYKSAARKRSAVTRKIKKASKKLNK